MAKKKNPSIFGKAMRRPMVAPLGSGVLVWKRGPLEVTIGPSTSGDRPDFQIWIEVFGFGVANDWRMTEELGAAWAERKLGQISRALSEPLMGQISRGMRASERYE
jgi:hypothetical protein